MIRIVAILGFLTGVSCASSNTEPGRDTDATASTKATASPLSTPSPKATPKIVVVSRTRALANYPCEQCHRHADFDQPRTLKMHREVRVDHMPGAICKSCHDPSEPSRLRLASEQPIRLEDAPKLCGQCHATELADWSVGIHGKQVGNWQKEIHRFSCTRCHDPHAPAIGTMQAVAAPPFPAMGIPKGAH